MAKHTNFYETIQEANMRLRGTVVLYDGEPYYVLCVDNHKGDGIFRIYLDKVREDGRLAVTQVMGVPYEWCQESPDGPTVGNMMDEFLDKNPDCGIIRKMMNSPKFNNFRPFPLGMVNVNGGVVYVERQPNRHTQQGLTRSMLSMTEITLNIKKGGRDRRSDIGIYSGPLYHTIMGNYPSVFDCVENLRDPAVTNDAAAFHREFALVRGPVGTLFLAYKSDVVGWLPNGDPSLLRLSKEFFHTKEAISDLGVFHNIQD